MNIPVALRRMRSGLIAGGLGWLSILPVAAQVPGRIDSTFNPADTVVANGQGNKHGGAIRSITADSNRLYIAGDFAMFSGTASQCLTRLDEAGIPDAIYPPGFRSGRLQGNPVVFGLNSFGFQATAVQPDHTLLIAGGFTKFTYPSGTVLNAKGLIRVLPDGLPDPAFQVGAGFTGGQIFSLKIQPDGRILAGGAFTQAMGQACNRICRLMPNGLQDTTFSTGAGFNGEVRSMALQPDGKLVVAGNFTQYNGTAVGRICRLKPSGALDPDFQRNAGFDAVVLSVEVGQAGRIWVGGMFTAFNGQARSAIACLESNGQLNISGDVALVANNYAEAVCYRVLPLPAGQVAIGGDFQFNDKLNLLLLNPDGSIAEDFLKTGSPDWTVYDLALDRHGDMLLCGEFSTVNDTTRRQLARLKMPEGRVDNEFMKGTGTNDAVYRMYEQADGKIMIAGQFTTVNGYPSRPAIARLFPDGSVDTTFRRHGMVNTLFEPSGVDRFAVSHLGDRIVAMGVQMPEGGPQIIVRLLPDGRYDSSFHGEYRPNYILKVLKNQKIILDQDSAAKAGRPMLQRLLPNGGPDSTFHCALVGNLARTDRVVALEETRDGKLVAAVTIGTSSPAKGRIVRLFADGSLDSSFSCTYTGSLSNMLLFPDGKVFLNGVMKVNQAPTRSCARLLLDGAFDSTYKADSVFRLLPTVACMQPNGKILFAFAGIASRKPFRLLRDGLKDPSFRPDSLSYATINCLALQKDGDILVGGNFTRIQKSVRNNFTRLDNCAPPAIVPAIDAPAEQAICLGDTVSLTLTAAGINPAWTYHWQFRPDTARPGSQAEDATWDEASRVWIVPLVSGQYRVAAISEICSTAVSAPVHVRVKPRPALPSLVSDSVAICDSVPALLRIASPLPGVSYRWSTGDTGSSTLVHTAGLVGAAAVQEGCRSVDSALATVFQARRPEAAISAGQDTVRQGAEAGYSTSGNPDYSYAWQAQSGSIISNVDSDSVRVLWNSAGSGILIVVVTETATGCTGSDTARIMVTTLRQRKDAASFEISPNPTAGWVKFVAPQSGPAILMDVQGRPVWRGWVEKATANRLDMRRLPAGLYQLMVGEHSARVVREWE